MNRLIDYLHWLEDHEFVLACICGVLLACSVAVWYLILISA